MCQVLCHYTAVFLLISLITTVHSFGSKINEGKSYVHIIKEWHVSLHSNTHAFLQAL